jgi:hypothetical protein
VPEVPACPHQALFIACDDETVEARHFSTTRSTLRSRSIRPTASATSSD